MKQASKSAVGAASWPFTEKDVKEIIVMIRTMIDIIQIGLASDGVGLTMEVGVKVGELGDVIGEASAVLVAKADDTIVATKDVSLKVDGLSGQVTEVRDAVVSIRQELVKANEVAAAGLPEHQVKALLAWISPLNFWVTQQDTFSRWQEGTGQWLLDSQLFRDWEDGKRRSLLCEGMPGAGKSVMASMIINHLEQTLESNKSTALCFMYCKYNEAEKQSIENLLASLAYVLAIKQRHSPAIVAAIKEIQERHAGKDTRPTIHELEKLLKDHLKLYERVFLVIDALDECGDRDSLLRSIAQIAGTSGKVSVLITSRDLGGIPSQLREDEEVLQIAATDQDMEKFVQVQITRMPQRGFTLSDNAKKEIVDAIVEKAKGFFLLAKLHMDTVCVQVSIKNIRKTISELPQELTMTYENVMKRICSDSNAEAGKLALCVLQWVATAHRQLTILDLQHALATEPGPKFDEESIVSEDYIIQVCGGLVIIEKSSLVETRKRRIRFTHYTTKEYFEKRHAQYFPAAHEKLAVTCLDYLSYEALEYCFSSVDQLRGRLQTHPFVSYAAVHAHHHVRQAAASDILEAATKGFIMKKPKNVAFVIQFNQARRISVRSAMVDAKIAVFRALGSTPLIAAAFFGFTALVMELIGGGADFKVRGSAVESRTPMSCAAEFGYTDLMKELLALDGIRADDDDRASFAPPIVVAAREGHAEIVGLLLAARARPAVDVDVNGHDLHGWTALRFAAASRDASMVRMLLACPEVDPNREDDNSISPLLWAAKSGHRDVVELFYERTDLDLWSRPNGPGVIDVLYERGDLDAITTLVSAWDGDEAGMSAAEQCRLQQTSRLGFAGIRSLAQMILDGNATLVLLILSRLRAHYPVYSLIDLYHGIEALCAASCPFPIESFEDGLPLLAYAAAAGETAVAELLLDIMPRRGGVGFHELKCVCTSSHDRFVMQDSCHPVTFALITGNLAMLDLLAREKRLRPVSFLWTALRCLDSVKEALPLVGDAAMASLCHILQHVGEYGLDVNELLSDAAYAEWTLGKVGEDSNRSWHRFTEAPALCIAAAISLPATRLLLTAANIDIFRRDGRGASALHYAARAGRLDTAAALMDAGLMPSHDALAGWNPQPLHVAASLGHIDVALALVARGADVNAQDDDGNTALHLATSAECITALLALPAIDPRIRNHAGQTALVRAFYLDSDRFHYYKDIFSYKEDHFEYLEALVADGRLDVNDVTQMPLLCAIDFCKRTISSKSHRPPVLYPLQSLLGAAALDPNVGAGTYRGTALHHCCVNDVATTGNHWRNTIDIFSLDLLLQDPRVDPNAVDINGKTPLHSLMLYPDACYGVGPSAIKQVEEIKKAATLLLAHPKISPDLSDYLGRTPLSYAAERYPWEIVQILVAHPGVNPVQRDYDGRTPRDRAIAMGISETADGLAQYDIYDPDSWIFDD
ncbi:ankyrin repeat-containing domain protein [Peziza echinospora]|nr:ankyrin repeat-containing domain protein [Peziza echinospora]